MQGRPHLHSPLSPNGQGPLAGANEDAVHMPYGLGDAVENDGAGDPHNSISQIEEPLHGSEDAGATYCSDHTAHLDVLAESESEVDEEFRPYIARGRVSNVRFRDIAKEHAERCRREQEGGQRVGSSGESATAGVNESEDKYGRGPNVVPECVSYRRDVSKNGYSLSRIHRSLTYIIEPVYFALKVSVLVTLPLCVLAFYGPVKSHFHSGSLLAVVGTANAQLYVGSQLSSVVLVIQGACWVMLLGTVMNCIGVPHHEGAWWGLAFTSVLIVSFFPNFRSRKLMMSYGIIIMQMQRTPGGAGISRPANVAADLIMAVCFSTLQSFVPFPMLVSRQTDKLFAATWNQVADVARQLRGGVWLNGSYGGYVQTSRTACDDLGTTIADMPSKLFLITYEPFERSLWNQLRNVRLTLLRRLLVILYAACTAADAVTSMRTTDTLLRREPVVECLQTPMDEYLEALSFTLHELGQSLDPARTVANCKFDELLDRKDAAYKALQRYLAIISQMDPNTTDAPAIYAFIYFHLLLLMLAEEVSTLGEQMAAFNPAMYKSTWRRFLEFFFLDFWDDLCNGLPGRLALRTDAGVCCLKEGLKFACAYCVAAAFTLRLNSDHTSDTYFFGMSIILGIGLPTVSESIEVGIQRICGMAFALAIGYLAMWKTQNFTQAMAIVVCGSFVAVCFRPTQRYMHVAYYASFIAPAAYGIAADRVTMISRVVDNSFAVMCYLLICSFMFPINPIRVLWNKRTIIDKYAAEVITQLAAVAQLPLNIAELEDMAEAKLQIAADKLQAISGLLYECRTWANICAKQPIIVGKPFPTTKANEIHSVMIHLVAGLEVWLLGLHILHRKRPHPPQPLVEHMIKVLGPILRDADEAGRFAFQSMIDAIEVPLAWSQDRSYHHFSKFTLIKDRLDATFHEIHKGVMKAQNPAVRRRAVAKALAHGIDLTSPSALGTRSFVATSFISPDPRNVRGRADNGVYDEHDALFPHTTDTKGTEDTEAARRTQGPMPSDSGGGGGGARNSSPTAVSVSPQYGGGSSFAHATPTRQPTAMRMSFRAPVGDLPIDVDVTAITICIMSIGTLISNLEQLFPLTSAVNEFERSRLQTAVTSIREFYLCSSK